MRGLATALIAILVSGLTSGMTAVIAADWIRADETFILIFLSIFPVTLIVASVFLVRWARLTGNPSATDKIAMWMLIAVAFLFAGFSTWSFAGSYPADTAGREVNRCAAFAATFACIVLTQWLIFRRAVRAGA